MVGSGIKPRSAWPLGFTGSWLLGNGCPVAGLIGQSWLEPVVGLGHRSLKFPWRSAAEGTGVLNGLLGGTRSMRQFSDQKKNVFSRLVLNRWGMKTGPPRVYPKSFFLYEGTVASKKLRALNASLRKNSNSSPWNPLVPDLVSTSTVPEPFLPYCAP